MVHEFKMPENQEFIELNRLLKHCNICQTGGHAKIIIQDGEVSVNGHTETRVRKKLVRGDLITTEDSEIRII